jgi:hypothetical protein
MKRPATNGKLEKFSKLHSENSFNEDDDGDDDNDDDVDCHLFPGNSNLRYSLIKAGSDIDGSFSMGDPFRYVAILARCRTAQKKSRL